MFAPTCATQTSSDICGIVPWIGKYLYLNQLSEKTRSLFISNIIM